MRSPLGLALLLLACGDNDKATSGSGEAFPQGRVGRLDLTITADNWKAMHDDMVSMLGEFGAGSGSGLPGGGSGSGSGFPGGGSGSGMDIPPELYAACDGLDAGAPCSATVMGMDITGTCTDLNGLACIGGMGGGGGGIDMLDHTPIYVECTVTADATTWQHVGIRYKGNSSLTSSWTGGIEKIPFRLKFDEFDSTYPDTDKQRFYDYRELSLSNGWSDPSLVRDKLGTDVFAEAGFDVPKTAFYRVFIDHGEGPTYFGLYTASELPQDKVFLKEHFGDSDGNLYKPEGTGATFASYDEATLGKETNEDAADFSDVHALYDALHADRTDAAGWRAGLERWLDVDGFLRWLAYNTVMEDWDTYGRMSHNYYLYSRADRDGQLQWIPWDHTFAFNDAGGAFGSDLSLALDEVGSDWPLIRFLLDDPVYRGKYDGFVQEVVDTVYEPSAAKTRFATARALIEPYVLGAEGEQPGYTHLTSDADFTDAHAALQTHPDARKAAAAAYLAR